MIPENPPVSSIIATLLTFSNRLLTTHAPPTYAKPRQAKLLLFLKVRTEQFSFMD